MRALTRCTLASPSVTTLTLACPREDEWRVGYLPVRHPVHLPWGGLGHRRSGRQEEACS